MAHSDSLNICSAGQPARVSRHGQPARVSRHAGALQPQPHPCARLHTHACLDMRIHSSPCPSVGRY